jgi:hypothetical protein
LDIKDKGNTNAALPNITRPNIIALKAIGFLGLHHRGKALELVARINGYKISRNFSTSMS